MKGFVAKRLTFSEEVLEMMKEFRKAGSFRSLSETVEEIVRRLHFIKKFNCTLRAANVQLERLDIFIKEN